MYQPLNMANQAPPPAAGFDGEMEMLSCPGSPSLTAGSPEENPKTTGYDGYQLDDAILSQVLEDVDRFLEKLSAAAENDGDPVEVPDSVEILSKTVESMIDQCSYRCQELDSTAFYDAIDCLSRMVDQLGEAPPSPATLGSLNRTSTVIQRALMYLEDELWSILEQPKDDGGGGGGGKPDHHHHLDNNNNNVSTNNNTNKHKHSKSTTKHSSFNSRFGHHERTENRPEIEAAAAAAGGGSEEEYSFPGFSPEAVLGMNKIANAMIRAGYEIECCIIYSFMRRNSFKTALVNIGFEIVSIDDLQKMQWNSLEKEIVSWVRIVKESSKSLFGEEWKLCRSVFSGRHGEVAGRLFGGLVRAVCMQFLNFAEATMLTKRSTEKLFKFLDMYEAVRDLGSSIGVGGATEELAAEIEATKARIGETAVGMFGELENSIKSDHGRTQVPSGSVHPLTRYTMNYLEYTCVYRETLEQIFHQHQHRRPAAKEKEEAASTKFGKQLIKVMELLDSNLEIKSRLYKDPSLRYIFLMNNGRYILQKIRASPEIHEVTGDPWRRKRSTELRGYHKSYQRETWYRLLQFLNHEGLSVNGKVSKPVVKERFKSFNAMFDDIHKTQSTWVVSDEQLQSELRVSISSVITPAYRSFIGRFSQYLKPGRQSEKYIKYQPEDIESLVDELFDGNPTSMGRKKT
ncbi:hypothetical protein SAY87_015715 [Trapa incisa]|uniref:Exocyst subunit Exo70 family protein n=1 Tax=Trapa incisa TaxID=236973 RepID=A0AAN7L8M8_9MYRT|nr:hypothetical protein SAY87_015715 [Trapa incisa]